MILIFSLVFSGLFQVVLAFSNQGVADVMTFNYVWATTPIDNIFHLYSIPSCRIQFVSATLVFGLAAFDCSLAISSSHTSLGVL